jgi:3-oxoacyl-[acyl-carrier-protein] synthase III
MKKWILLVLILATSKIAFACDSTSGYIADELGINIASSVEKQENSLNFYLSCHPYVSHGQNSMNLV